MNNKKLINNPNSITTKVIMSDSVSNPLEVALEPIVRTRLTLPQFMNECNSYMTWICSQSPTTILLIGVVTGYLNGSVIALMIPRTISYLLGLMSGIVAVLSGYVMYTIDIPKEFLNQLRSVTVSCLLISIALFLKSVATA